MMKKLLVLSLLCVAVLFSSCGVLGNTEATEVTEWKPAATAEVNKNQSAIVNVIEEKVKVDEETYSVTETFEATETEESTETEATKSTEETTAVPTQGVVNPYGHRPVTTAMGSFSPEDADFIYENSVIKPGDDIENVFEAIGEDNISQEVTETQWKYIYKDFVLYTDIDAQDNETLIKIEPLNKNHSTSKGVKIGDYASALVRIYGNPVKQENGVKTYEKDKKQLIFKYENNRITEITYGYAK